MLTGLVQWELKKEGCIPCHPSLMPYPLRVKITAGQSIRTVLDDSDTPPACPLHNGENIGRHTIRVLNKHNPGVRSASGFDPAQRNVQSVWLYINLSMKQAQ